MENIELSFSKISTLDPITLLYVLINGCLFFFTKGRSAFFTGFAILLLPIYLFVNYQNKVVENTLWTAPHAVTAMYATWFCYILASGKIPDRHPASGSYTRDGILVVSIIMYLMEMF